MQSTTHRRLLAACSVVVASISASNASAALPIYGGATYGFAPLTGYLFAHTNPSPAGVISNIGRAIAQATFRTPSVNNGGDRPLFWTPVDWYALPIGPTPSNGMIEGNAYAINQSNVIVYDSQTFSNGTNLGYRAGRLDPGGATGLNNLGTSASGVADTHAFAINNAGVSVGSSSKWINNVFYGNRATRWAAGKTSVEELGVLQTKSGTNAADASALDINAAGLVVGQSQIFSNATDLGTRAVKWDAAGNITALGVLGTFTNGATAAKAIGVSDSGVIAGVSNKYDANHNFHGDRAVRYAAGSTTAVELGTLGTDNTGYSSARVLGLNDDLIVGASNRYNAGADVGVRAAYWNTGGSTVAIELPSLGTNPSGATSTLANAINASSNIVGTAAQWTGSAGSNRAVLWTTAGTDAVIDLNSYLSPNSGWTLSEADGISDTGFISGSGFFDPDGAGGADGYTRSFSMLIPQAGTYGKGDANFDTHVNFDDLIVLAQNYGKANSAKAITVGDFNLDGQTNFDDLIILAQRYNTDVNTNLASLESVSPGFAADWALAQSLVPEPAAFPALGLACFLRRRR